MGTLFRWSILVVLLAGAAPSWASYKDYVCVISDGSWMFDTHGPTAASASAYALRICQEYGQRSNCDPLRSAICQLVSSPSPVPVGFIGAKNVRTGEVKYSLTRTVPAPRRATEPAPSSGNDWVHRAPPGRCVALTPSDQMICGIKGQTFAAATFCGGDSRCIWIPGN